MMYASRWANNITKGNWNYLMSTLSVRSIISDNDDDSDQQGGAVMFVLLHLSNPLNSMIMTATVIIIHCDLLYKKKLNTFYSQILHTLR